MKNKSVMVLFFLMLCWFSLPQMVRSALTSHTEATLDALLLALDSDADGAFSDETWYTTPIIAYGTNPTVDADGEIAHDTTADQLIYGADANVLHPVYVTSGVIENLSSGDDNYEIGMWPYAVTITAIGVHCTGTCSSLCDISLEDRSGTAMTHGSITVSTTTGNTTFTDVTAANSLVAGEGLRFDVDTGPATGVDDYTISIAYTIDRQ
jgi:hypothetical protein